MAKTYLLDICEKSNGKTYPVYSFHRNFANRSKLRFKGLMSNLYHVFWISKNFVSDCGVMGVNTLGTPNGENSLDE